jgi:hypothetical protein
LLPLMWRDTLGLDTVHCRSAYRHRSPLTERGEKSARRLGRRGCSGVASDASAVGEFGAARTRRSPINPRGPASSETVTAGSGRRSVGQERGAISRICSKPEDARIRSMRGIGRIARSSIPAKRTAPIRCSGPRLPRRHRLFPEQHRAERRNATILPRRCVTSEGQSRQSAPQLGIGAATLTRNLKRERR